MKQKFKWLLALVAMVASVNLMGASPATGDWDLTSSKDGWSATGNETYFSQPYGYKKANGTLTNANVADFTNCAKDGKTITSIKVGFKGLRNGATASKITISLVDKDGNILTSGSELELTNANTANKTAYVYSTFTTGLTGATGFMMKVTTFGKNVLINAASYEIAYEESDTPVAPSITTQPEGATYEKDATATALSVEASGNPTPTYQWYSNSTNSTSGASAIANATNASYTPSTATIGTKYYYCVATNTQGSATSDIVAVTVTAGFEGKKLTFNLSTNNLNLPTAKGSSVAGDYTYTLNDVNYTFSVTDAQGSSDGGVYFSSSYTMVYASNAIGLPAISGYKLVKVEASNTSGCSTSVLVAIKDGPTADDNDVTGGTAQTWSTQSSTYTYNLSGTDENTMYYLYVSNKNAQITGLTLYYQELDPTNEAVTFAAPEGGSLVIKNGATPIATGATIQDGTVLDVEFEMTPAGAYKDVAIKVTNTSTSADVTSTVYNSETQKITMPRYPITVAVTFTKLYKIEAATVTGGTFSWEDANHAKPTYVEVGALIQASQEAATHYEFKSFDIYKTGETTTKVEDADGLFEMPAYDVTISGTFDEMQCTALPSAPVLGTPSISYADGVTLNWNKLDAASGYVINVWKGTDKIVEDEVIDDVNTLSYKITETMDVNTEYSYSIAGLGDDETYCMLGNPANQSTFTTADYPAATLTLSENGVETPLVGKLNTPITLPTESTQACDGKVFMGWSATEIDGETDVEPSLLGTTYTFTDPEQLTKTIYAVYAKEVEGDKYFEKVSSAPADWCGKYLIVYETGNLAMNGSLTTLDAVSNTKAVTISNNKIAWSQDMDDISFTIAYKTGSSTVYSLKSASGKYISGTTTSATASNGLKQADTDANYEISFDGLTLQSKSSDQQMVLKYNDAKDQTRFRFYKSGQKDIALYKYSATIDYSNYCTTCEAAIAVPIFSLAEGEYNEAKTLTLSAAEGDIYYTINDGEETKYTAAIALNNRGTYEISAYAKVDDRTSETVTKTYTLDWAYTLAELVAEGAPTSTGRTVTVILDNEVITKFATSGIYINGFYTMVGTQEVEVYCYNSPATWEVGGKVSGTVTCPWKLYNSTWELCPTNWDWASYTAPAKITSLVINNDVTNKNYTAGQKLDFTGLTVTGVYSDNTDQNAHTEDVTDEISWTEVTLTQGQESATATATLNNAKTDNKNVSENKTIIGLTVGAAKTLVSIYVDNEHSTHKKAFFVGRPFSAEGLIVMAHYNMGDDQQIALANLTIDNPTFSAAEAEHTINISYTENEVEKSTSYKVSVGYMNLSDLVAEDIPTNTSVKVAFSNVEITGFYTNKSDQRTGVYVNVIGKNGSNIELYSGGTPSETLNGWQAGGKLASKGDYITGTWKYYDGGSVWEIDFGSSYAWSTNIEYTAPSIYPTDVDMSIPSATVKQSKSLDLDAIFTPTNATVLNNLAWESDNAKVTVVPSQDKKSAKVTVAPDATVGTATITVKVDDKDGNKLSATCEITIQEYSVPHYGLYTGDITEGDYIFKADGEYYYMNNTNNNGRLANVANENKPEIVNNIITTDAEAYVWHIAKSGDYWTIQNLENSKYVSSTAKSSAGLVDDATANTALWTITYDATNEVYTFVNLGRSQAASDADKCYLRNNNNNGWACYASGTGNAITLYKAGFTPAAALQSIEIKGDLEITEYFQGKSVKYDGLSVLGHYSDETSATITDGIEWSASPATFTEKGDNISVTITATVQTKNGEITDDANFTVKVVESQKVSYGLVTSVNTLYDGATIILGAVFGTAAAPIYAVNQGFESKYLKAYRSNDPNGSDLEYENEVMKTAYASEITLKKVEGGWKLLGEDGKYINGAGDLSQTTDVAEATVWTISIEDGVTKIASGSNIIYYNTSSPRFKTYTSTQQEIGIYMKNLVAVRTGLTAGKIGTICYPQAIAAVDGATLYQPDYKDYNETLGKAKNIYFIEVAPEDRVAGLPMMFEANGAIIKVLFTGNAVSDPIGNRGMVGNLNEANITLPQDGNSLFFQNNKLHPSDGTATVGKNRAYIDLANVPAQENQVIDTTGKLRRCAMNVIGGQAPTNLNGLNDNVKAQKVMKDGQFYIIRDTKTYNAQGFEVQ